MIFEDKNIWAKVIKDIQVIETGTRMTTVYRKLKS